MKVITWPLSSEAPRETMISPERGSSARRGAKGGVVHSSKGSRRLHVVVAVTQDA